MNADKPPDPAGAVQLVTDFKLWRLRADKLIPPVSSDEHSLMAYIRQRVGELSHALQNWEQHVLSNQARE